MLQMYPTKWRWDWSTPLASGRPEQLAWYFPAHFCVERLGNTSSFPLLWELTTWHLTDSSHNFRLDFGGKSMSLVE